MFLSLKVEDRTILILVFTYSGTGYNTNYHAAVFKYIYSQKSLWNLTFALFKLRWPHIKTNLISIITFNTQSELLITEFVTTISLSWIIVTAAPELDLKILNIRYSNTRVHVCIQVFKILSSTAVVHSSISMYYRDRVSIILEYSSSRELRVPTFYHSTGNSHEHLQCIFQDAIDWYILKYFD